MKYATLAIILAFLSAVKLAVTLFDVGRHHLRGIAYAATLLLMLRYLVKLHLGEPLRKPVGPGAGKMPNGKILVR